MIEGHATIDFSIPAMREMWKLPEEKRAEVINRKLYILSPPKPDHCDLSFLIALRLANYVIENNLGKVCHAEMGIFLNDGKNLVIPDIVFVSNANPLILDTNGIFGAPDLIIEVLSPSTKRKDRTIKKQLYEQTGVREYWLVDPISKESWGYLLENGRYDEPLTLNAELNIRILNKTIPF